MPIIKAERFFGFGFGPHLSVLRHWLLAVHSGINSRGAQGNHMECPDHSNLDQPYPCPITLAPLLKNILEEVLYHSQGF